MKSAYLFALAAAAALSACATPSQAASADGSSPERAVVINENDTFRGIEAENRWITAHLPGCRKNAQALLQQGGRIYDRITVTCPDGQRHVYFDIVSFFGRYNGQLLGQ